MLFRSRRTLVEANTVRKTGLNLDEAGAIHVGPAQGPWGSDGTVVRRNLIVSVTGNAAGTAGSATRAYGIFLDEKTADTKVEGNFIADADVGVCVRRGRAHEVAGNLLYGNRLAPWRDGLASAGSGETTRNRYQGNVVWALRGKSSGFLTATGTGTACGTGSTARPCSAPANLVNLACAESEGSPTCDGDPGLLYPGVSASQLATRFGDFAKQAGAGFPDAKSQTATLQAILPVAKGP